MIDGAAQAAPHPYPTGKQGMYFGSPLRAAVFWSALALAPLVQGAEFVGVKVCSKCHFDQGDSWKTTAHARSLDSLKPGAKAAAKSKAKLDPAKDYSADKDCVGCHVTGYGEPGGYRADMDADSARQFAGVGCEACHGAGGGYRSVHGDAGDRLKVSGNTTPRQAAADAGQNFDYEKACARCHLNYPGSPWAEVKVPHTPFTPTLDAKYGLDFRKSALAGEKNNPIHMHFKLRGVFKGGPIPAIRAEVQSTAREPEE